MKKIFVYVALTLIYHSKAVASKAACLQLFAEINSGRFYHEIDTAYGRTKNFAAIRVGDEVTISLNGSGAVNGRYSPGLIGSNIGIYFQPVGRTLAERVLVKKIIFENGIAVGFQAIKFQALMSLTETTYLFKDIDKGHSFIDYKYRYFQSPSEILRLRPVAWGDYYEILRVNHDATSGQIHEAYYRMIMQFDTDRGVTPEADYDFTQVKKAYEILMNPILRRLFDEIRY